MPSLRLGHYSPGAFGPLNLIETLKSASNYYLDTLRKELKKPRLCFEPDALTCIVSSTSDGASTQSKFNRPLDHVHKEA